MQHTLIVISTVLLLISPVVYIRSILQGESKPHRTTRFVLLIVTILSTLSLVNSELSAAFWLAAASALQSLAIFGLSIRHGYGGWARLDIVCLVIALIGIILWQVTGQPIVGLLASIVADYVGMVPALVKTYRLPFTETWWFYGIDTVAGILTFLALDTYTAYTASFPVYIVLVNAAMVVIILARRPQVKSVQ